MQLAALQPETLMKTLVVGEIGVGKTSLIQHYVNSTFSKSRKATIGVDFALKIINRGEQKVHVQLWDIGGQERHGNMTRVYYKDSVGAFVVADITKGVTFDGALRWKDDIREKQIKLPNGQVIPVILLANKSDLRESSQVSAAEKNKYITDEAIEDFATKNGFDGYVITSALKNTGMDEAVKLMIEKISAISLLPTIATASATSGTVVLTNPAPQPASSGCAC